MKNFEWLINQFQKIKKSEEFFPTFIEIAGYPSYENVASNILKFYLNTNEKHGLKELVLKSLLECHPQFTINNTSFDVLKVHRELVVDEQKRIDLVVVCNDYCVSIENKIFHYLHNDLSIYERSIENRFTFKTNYHIVLSLKKEIVTGKFVSITYQDFIIQIKKNLGYYAFDSNNNYLLFLLDFIKTIERHYLMEDINKDMFNFLIEHKEVLDTILHEKSKLNDALIRTLHSVKQMVNFTMPNVREWVYNDNFLVYDFNIDSAQIAVHVVFELDKVYMFIGGRNAFGKSILSKLKIAQLPESHFKMEHLYIFEDKLSFFEIDKESLAIRIHDYLNLIYISEI